MGYFSNKDIHRTRATRSRVDSTKASSTTSVEEMETALSADKGSGDHIILPTGGGDLPDSLCALCRPDPIFFNGERERFHVTFFSNRFAKTLTAKEMSLAELRDLVLSTTAANKDSLSLLKFAVFGDERSGNGCLRHNANVKEISGVELDYDDEAMPFEEAVRKLVEHRLLALVYTSPSHTSEKPRWRVVLPTSKNLPGGGRAKLVARVNGVLDGVIGPESFTLSQSYYFGRVGSNPDHRAVVVSGDFVDLRGDLDASAIGRANGWAEPQPTTIAPPAAHETATANWLNTANPDWLTTGLAMGLTPHETVVAAAVAAIGNPDRHYNEWIKIGLATYATTGDSEGGRKIFDAFSEMSEKHNKKQDTNAKWREFRRARLDRYNYFSLFNIADDVDRGWGGRYDEQLDAGFRKAARPENITKLLAEIRAERGELPEVDSGSIVAEAEPQTKAKDEPHATFKDESAKEIAKLIAESAGAKESTEAPVEEEPSAPEDYIVSNGAIYWLKPVRNGVVPTKLSNFTAEIVEDVKIDDGSGVSQRRFIIDGNLGRAEVSVEKFDGMTWVTREWGADAATTPGPYHEKHLAIAIKTLSKKRVKRTVYAHLGWRDVKGKLVFLHAGGAIGANGPVEGIEVDPGPALSKFVLPPVTDLVAAVKASLKMLDVAPKRITWPLWCSVYRAPLAHWVPVTVTPWNVGPSGVLKTAAAMVMQQHYGVMQTPPANWSSTANANEKTAFIAKDVACLIDDFVPKGTSYEVAKKHAEAERLCRGQGNQGGRQRMNADGSMRQTYYPRGLLFGTGEDVPVGHSLRARLVTVEIERGDIDTEKLTPLQAAAENGQLAEAIAGYVSWLARQDHTGLSKRERELRAEGRGDHLRVPENLAVLMLGAEMGLKFARECGAITEDREKELREDAWSHLKGLADAQTQFLNSEKPADRFTAMIGAIIASGRGHLASVHGGEPSNPDGMGWQVVARSEEGREVLRGQGRTIGWVDDNNMYLDPEVAYSEVQQLASSQHAPLTLTKNVLWKRLATEGHLLSQEPGHYTTKKMVAGMRKRVLHLSLSALGIEAKDDPKDALKDDL